jgi:hypothetical protein
LKDSDLPLKVDLFKVLKERRISWEKGIQVLVEEVLVNPGTPQSLK